MLSTNSKRVTYFENLVRFNVFFLRLYIVWTAFAYVECLFILGLATLKVRVPGSSNGGRLVTVQSKLDVLAEELYGQIASKLEIESNRFV